MTDAQHTDRADDAGLSAEELDRLETKLLEGYADNQRRWPHKANSQWNVDGLSHADALRLIAAARTAALTAPAGGAAAALHAAWEMGLAYGVPGPRSNDVAAQVLRNQQRTKDCTRLFAAPTPPAFGAGGKTREALVILGEAQEAHISVLRDTPVAGGTDFERRASEGEIEARADEVLGEGLVELRREHVDALLAALAQPAAPAAGATEWQPIETAPKNRGVLIAMVNDDVRLIAWGKTSHVPLYGWCLADQGVEDFNLCEPTHWMPLPDPPRAALTAGGAGE